MKGKPGWVFKLGEAGLGYYRDRGGLVVTVSLAQAIQPTAGIPAAPISLDELIVKPAEVPKLQQIANRMTFTPAGVAATCAAIWAANGPPTDHTAASSSVRQRIQMWDSRVAAGELRPIPTRTRTTVAHDAPTFQPGAVLHHTTSTTVGRLMTAGSGKRPCVPRHARQNFSIAEALVLPPTLDPQSSRGQEKGLPFNSTGAHAEAEADARAAVAAERGSTEVAIDKDDTEQPCPTQPGDSREVSAAMSRSPFFSSLAAPLLPAIHSGNSAR